MILVVEDDGPSRRAVTLALKTAGHEVMNASDGVEALELLSIHHFELVITDLLMPKLNGQCLFNTIRPKWPHMPIILMSGYLSQDLGNAITDGISAFLQKPFTPTALIVTVERLLPKASN